MDTKTTVEYDLKKNESAFDVFENARKIFHALSHISCVRVRLYESQLLLTRYSKVEDIINFFIKALSDNQRNMSTPTAPQINQFDLQRAMDGEPIETVEGRPRVFIAYRTDRRERLRLVVLDPIADKLYSHYATGEHCEQVRSLALRMKPKARRKVTRYIVTEMQDSVRYLFGVLYENESDAKLRAETIKDGQIHPITVEVDA